jgi:hypothetical protein
MNLITQNCVTIGNLHSKQPLYKMDLVLKAWAPLDFSNYRGQPNDPSEGT